MRDLVSKIIIIFFVTALESSVGLPVLSFILFLVWRKKELRFFLVWLVLVALFVSIMWGLVWWIACLFLLSLRVTYDYFEKFISNKLLKLILVISPITLIFAFVLGIDFYWRIVFYGSISFLIVFLLQRFLLINYENKYL